MLGRRTPGPGCVGAAPGPAGPPGGPPGRVIRPAAYRDCVSRRKMWHSSPDETGPVGRRGGPRTEECMRV